MMIYGQLQNKPASRTNLLEPVIEEPGKETDEVASIISDTKSRK